MTNKPGTEEKKDHNAQDSRHYKPIDVNRLVCPIMVSHTHIWGDWYYHHNGGGEFENDWRECVMCGLIMRKYRNGRMEIQ